MKNLRLDRPLVVFDLETTGTDPATDRIVEISALRIEVDGSRSIKTRRLDPERPIPPGATAVHGIRDDDVRGAPTFRQVARSLLWWVLPGVLVDPEVHHGRLSGVGVGHCTLPTRAENPLRLDVRRAFIDIRAVNAEWQIAPRRVGPEHATDIALPTQSM